MAFADEGVNYPVQFDISVIDLMMLFVQKNTAVYEDLGRAG